MTETKTQKFGIEIELTILTRCSAANVLAKYFGTEYSHVGGSYDTYTVRDGDNRSWKVVSDASLICSDENGRSASKLYSVELVSPICVYDDIETIQEIVRKLRAAGAVANKSCGIRVHINGAPYNTQTLRNITNIMHSKENLLYRALQVEEMVPVLSM